MTREAINELKKYTSGKKNTEKVEINVLKLNRVIKALEQEPKWIPVSERLPEYGEAVITVNSDDDYEINHIIDDDLNEWFYDGVVAWMPLPELFEAESEDNA